MTKLIMKHKDPFGPWPTAIPSSLFGQLEKLFFDLDSYNPVNGSWKMTKGFPKGDLFFNEEGHAVIELGLAGYEREQLSVTANNNRLTISAKKCDEEGASKPRTLARRAFTEEVVFSKEFDLSNTEVTYKNGLLRIVVPKVQRSESSIVDIEIK